MRSRVGLLDAEEGFGVGVGDLLLVGPLGQQVQERGGARRVEPVERVVARQQDPVDGRELQGVAEQARGEHALVAMCTFSRSTCATRRKLPSARSPARKASHDGVQRNHFRGLEITRGYLNVAFPFAFFLSTYSNARYNSIVSKFGVQVAPYPTFRLALS